MSKIKQDLSAIIYNIASFNCEVSYKCLFAALYPALNKFSFSIVKSRELSEEIAGDVMIQLWRRREKLLEINNIYVYSFIIAKNLSLNTLRKNSGSYLSLEEVDVNLNIDPTNPEQILINEELRKELGKAINTLPPRCKMVFKLVKEDGFSYKEAAEILGISTKTVDAQLVTALKRIAAALQAEYKLS